MATRILASLALSAWLLAGAVALAQDQPRGTKLTGADLTKLVEPAVLLEGYNWQFGVWVSTALLRGGTIYTHNIGRGGTGSQDKGKWRITGDVLCFALNYPPEEQCRTYYKLDDGSYEGWSIPGNKRIATFRARRPE